MWYTQQACTPPDRMVFNTFLYVLEILVKAKLLWLYACLQVIPI